MCRTRMSRSPVFITVSCRVTLRMNGSDLTYCDRVQVVPLMLFRMVFLIGVAISLYALMWLLTVLLDVFKSSG